MELVVVGVAVAAIAGWTRFSPNRRLRVSRLWRADASRRRETNRATYRANSVISFVVLISVATVLVLVVRA